MKKKIVILGATGSIGESTLKVILSIGIFSFNYYHKHNMI